MKAAVLVLLFAGVVAARANIVGKEIVYSADSVTMKGYIAYDDKIAGKRPGILVVHEWWGNNDYSKKRADMLAGLGYVAFALDMYGNGAQAANPDEAGKLAGSVMQHPDVMKSRFVAAMNMLKMDEHVNPDQIGAIGYCFGGSVVLGMVRDGADLKGAVSFHGNLATQHRAEKGAVKGKLLVCNGAADSFVSADDIKNLKEEMKSAGGDLKFVNYPGAVHAFTNPAATELGKKFNMKIAYNENADKKSWEEMRKFFKKVFKE